MLDFSKNYFELFGLPVGYIVDTEQLSAHYRELQRAVHPDRFANATEQERRLSMQGAVRINEAYETLKDPVLRASYLLSLNGIEMEHGRETTRDAAFLMEQMELREELEAARDKPDPYAVIAEFMTDVTDCSDGGAVRVRDTGAAGGGQRESAEDAVPEKTSF
jgi:molecular chaperone HscB